MNMDFDLNRFIQQKVTRREKSLLADDFARYDAELHRRIDNKRVLVIGGAGSIGSHYIKALLRFNIDSLCVVDINENGLTELVRDLRSAGGYNIPKEFITYPINFGDRVFEKIFRAQGPFDIVANFAAHKHVRSEKDIFSIEAMIENNLLRARGLLDLLMEKPPQHFFCVSTDKAANPVNIMGASKKLMEFSTRFRRSEVLLINICWRGHGDPQRPTGIQRRAGCNAIRALGQGQLLVLGEHARAARDDFHRRAVRRANPPRRLVAVHHRHAQVHHHKLRQRFGTSSHRLRAVHGGADFEADGGEQEREQLEVFRLVINDQYPAGRLPRREPQ